MTQKLFGRRRLLQGGVAALLGLMSRRSFAEVLQSGNEAITGDDGLLAAQLRLGELLIRHLAGHKAGAGTANTSGNVVVSPASLAAILSFVDLGGSNRMHSAI